MKKWGIVLLLGVVITGGIVLVQQPQASPKEGLLAEQFVEEHLLQEDGLMRTNLTTETDVYLSESISLWMQYLVKKNDEHAFAKQVDVLETYFLTNSEKILIPWRLVGSEAAPANALIDDFRVIAALVEATDEWNQPTYEDLAKAIGEDIVTFNQLEGIFVNHVDLQNGFQGDFLTLSYLDPLAIDYLYEENLLSEKSYTLNQGILLNAPVADSGFFPFTYYPQDETYEFEEEVNLIDQYYVGYYRALWGGDVSDLIAFTEHALATYDGILYGRFSSETLKPIVDYEGASVYALAVLMSIEAGEDELAKTLYTSMKRLQIQDSESPYDGGYMDEPTMDTHAFDNLLPLLAERRGLDAGIFDE